MSLLPTLHKTGTHPRIGYRGLSVLLGAVTLATFVVERFLSETAGQALGAVPAYVMGGVLLVVAASVFHASLHGRDSRTVVLLSAGPVGGFFVYVLGYHLVLPPSTDSPTWLIFLAFAGGFLAIGTVAHLCGRGVSRGL